MHILGFIIGLQTVRKFKNLLHVSAQRSRHQEISNTKENKYQYASLGSVVRLKYCSLFLITLCVFVAENCLDTYVIH
jgi:hypothetical protein